jgi:hypothetical protein
MTPVMGGSSISLGVGGIAFRHRDPEHAAAGFLVGWLLGVVVPFAAYSAMTPHNCK